MARINLLPWRETQRKKRQRDFGFSILGAVLVVAAGCGATHFYIESMIEFQGKRNNLLRQEIAEMDKKIKEIRSLEQTKAKLIARMEVIQELQASRPLVVHLFDELVKTVPEGAYLEKLDQKATQLTLAGRAQSNARVSSYMRNIDASEWIGKPLLQVITNRDQTGTGLSHFTLMASQLSSHTEQEQMAQANSKK